jgi:hypothetical protein
MIRTHLLVFFMVIILGGYGFFSNLAIAAPLVHIGASSYTVNGQSSLILSSEMDLKGTGRNRWQSASGENEVGFAMALQTQRAKWSVRR